MIKANELSQVIANSWNQIVIALGTDREAFERQLLVLLRSLDDKKDANQSALIQSILDLFRKFEAANKQLLLAISGVTTFQRKGINSPSLPAGAVKMDRYTVVPVFYGTDRNAVNKPSAATSYGGERGDLALGVAEVSIPDDHRMGRIEKPRIWKLQFREDPQKHVVVMGIEPLSRDAFSTRARGALNSSSKKEALIFVHGYNVGFADAVCRAAQISYDLHFEGISVLYSWASEGATLKYTVDETNVMLSRPHFLQFLALIRENLGADSVHIIAHSMGNRLVAETVSSWPALTTGSARLRQIVFAAPDVDSDTFKSQASGFHKKAERFTLYASSEDNAIKASHAIHKYPRAGDSGLGLVVVDSIDTVDATAVDTSLVGHSYYGDNRSVLTDIFELIRRGSAPKERFGLFPKKRYGDDYWLFSP